MASKLGVGVVGVGTLGRRHAENLRSAIPGCTLVAVADTDVQRARRVAEDLEIEHFEDSVDGLASRKDIQAIVIAAPSKFHASAIETAAVAGKHVFCEKPLALTVAEANAAIAAVDRAGIQLQIGFMRRFDPAYANAKKRIEAGEIGKPIIFKALGRDRQPPPASFFRAGINGTLFSDSSIHEFDLARWLMQDEVAEVHAYAGVVACPELAEFGDIDACMVNMRFASGGLGNVESFRQCRYGYDIRTEVVGTMGTLQIGYLQQTGQQVLTSAGITYDVVDHWLVRFREAYLNEIKVFVQTISSGGSSCVTGGDGLQALAIALAAESSYRESRPVAVSKSR